MLVEHYRLADGRLGRSLGWGAAILTTGAIVMAAALAVPHFDAQRPLHAQALHPATRRLLTAPGEVTADGEPVRRPPGLELLLGVVGLGLIVGGGLTAIFSLRPLSDERYLALRTDGVFFHWGTAREGVLWEDVEAIRWDTGARALVFQRHDGTAWVRPERFAGADGPQIATRAAEIRRKALFGLLRARR